MANELASELVRVTLMTRSTCGSCARVAAQIEPVVRDHGGALEIVDVDAEPDVAAEFGDRVPVVLVDDEEIACWEVDNDELIEAMEEARNG
nr:glutaredoxin family protein [Corynebacterium lactis]